MPPDTRVQARYRSRFDARRPASSPSAGGSDRPRRSLSERVAEPLVLLIEQRGLRPGDFLPSHGELSERFGVSRPIMLEATQGLAGARVLEVHSGRGAMVAPLNRIRCARSSGGRCNSSAQLSSS